MRIKVLDIVLPFLLCFNWSIKETDGEEEGKNIEEERDEKNASWPIESSGYELESFVYRYIGSENSFWSMMKRSRKQNPAQNEQPKVLLAFQSSRAGNKIYNQYTQREREQESERKREEIDDEPGKTQYGTECPSACDIEQ